MKAPPIKFGTLVRIVTRNCSGVVVEVGRKYVIVKLSDGSMTITSKENLVVNVNAD